MITIEIGLEVGCFVGFLHPSEENLPTEKSCTDEDFLNKCDFLVQGFIKSERNNKFTGMIEVALLV